MASISVSREHQRRLSLDGGFSGPERIVARCRKLMREGTLRPTLAELTSAAITVGAVNRYFESLGDLYRTAIADLETRHAVLARAMPDGPWPSKADCDRIIEAIVVGRLGK